MSTTSLPFSVPTHDQLHAWLNNNPTWRLAQDERRSCIVAEFRFPTFRAARNFVNQSMNLAKDMDHHPELWNSFRSVILTLKSWDANDTVAEIDLTMAEKLSDLAEAA